MALFFGKDRVFRRRVRDRAGPAMPVGADLPVGTDWCIRPLLWCGPPDFPAVDAPPSGQSLGDGITVWHDCPHRAIVLRRTCMPGYGGDDGGRQGLRIDLNGFAGSFLSLAIDIPAGGLSGLRPDQIWQFQLDLETECLVNVYARLNIVQGPNTQSLPRRMSDPDPRLPDPCLSASSFRAWRLAHFDLAYAGLDRRTVDRAWLDVILEAPRMSAAVMRDAVLSRRPRAQI